MKQLIIASVLRRIEQVGFRKFTIDGIVRDLQISKKTVYKYFKNKDQIVETAAETLHKQGMIRVQEILDSSDKWDVKLQQIMYCHQEKPPWIYAELKKFYPQVWAKGQKAEAMINRNVKEVLQEGVRPGAIRPDLNLDLVVIMFRTIVMHLALEEHILMEQNMTLKEAIPMVQSIFDQGIFL